MTEESLRVAFSASALSATPAGAGVYTLELGRALVDRGDINLLVAAPAGVWPGETTWQTPSGVLARNRWEQQALTREMVRHEVDVYHGPHFATPVRSQIPRVATVHDLTFYRLPRRYGWGHLRYYKALAWTGARADRLIVPSAAVAGDVVRYLDYPIEQVRVIAEAPRTGMTPASDEQVATVRGRLGVSTPYLLTVGTAEPGKRAVDVIRAMQILHEQHNDVALVLAGNPGKLSGALESEVARLGLTDRVVFAGYVDDEDLRALYTGAVALVFPSLYEGFGLPPLEAMACGTPVITSDKPAMDDILKGAAEFVPIRDPRSIARAAELLLRNPSAREALAMAGREHATRFSWEKAAAETAEVYRELVR